MIVIEGLAMPKGEDDGILIALYDGKAHQIGTKKTFTASEVPAHWRLIDADKLRVEFPEPADWKNVNEALHHVTGIWAAIDCAETVFPEEGEVYDGSTG